MKKLIYLLLGLIASANFVVFAEDIPLIPKGNEGDPDKGIGRQAIPIPECFYDDESSCVWVDFGIEVGPTVITIVDIPTGETSTADFASTSTPMVCALPPTAGPYRLTIRLSDGQTLAADFATH